MTYQSIHYSYTKPFIFQAGDVSDHEEENVEEPEQNDTDSPKKKPRKPRKVSFFLKIYVCILKFKLLELET